MKHVTLQICSKCIAIAVIALTLQACQKRSTPAKCTDCQHSPIKTEDYSHTPQQDTSTQITSGAYRCLNANSFQGQVIGDGHCVSLIRRCSNAPFTQYWRPGALVTDSAPPTGTIIATFKNGRYPNKTGYHAAIFIKQDEYGIWVWDQWLGKPVHRRLIRFSDERLKHKTPAANTAQAYRLVLAPN